MPTELQLPPSQKPLPTGQVPPLRSPLPTSPTQQNKASTAYAKRAPHMDFPCPRRTENTQNQQELSNAEVTCERSRSRTASGWTFALARNVQWVENAATRPPPPGHRRARRSGRGGAARRGGRGPRPRPGTDESDLRLRDRPARQHPARTMRKLPGNAVRALIPRRFPGACADGRRILRLERPRRQKPHAAGRGHVSSPDPSGRLKSNCGTSSQAAVRSTPTP